MSPSPPQTPSIDANDILTVLDAEAVADGLPLPHYDAFLLYDNSNAVDCHFAAKVLHQLTVVQNLRLCHANDLLRNSSAQRTVQMRLLLKRCTRLIVVLSDSFNSHGLDEYLNVFSRMLDGRCRALIPCSEKTLRRVPLMFSSATILNMERASDKDHYWYMFYMSVRTPLANRSMEAGCVNSLANSDDTAAIDAITDCPTRLESDQDGAPEIRAAENPKSQCSSDASITSKLSCRSVETSVAKRRFLSKWLIKFGIK